jgi:tetratricopeptide (TPR) repeat protein
VTTSSRQVPPSPPSTLETLVARLAEEMTDAWHRGERPQVEDFLAQYPDLRTTPQAAAHLVYEEICLREEAGEEHAAAEVSARFPQWQAELEMLLDCLRLLQQPVLGAPVFPEVGATLDGLHLVHELGRGAKGRVFLAVQPSLADRPVVLKITAAEGQEHLALARLQHTFILPLYHVQDFPDRRLRALWMPYLGGTTLAHLLTGLRTRPLAERAGPDLLRELDRIERSAPLPLPLRGPARDFFSRASYVDVVCTIGECLAEALQYAHERGLLHLDVKPSNILLAADAQPMLLDFHLARPPLRRGQLVPDWFGGTPEYMSPEQRETLDAVRQRQPVPQHVGPRSDVYSLGLVLYEALAGALPGNPAVPLHRCNPAVSVSLSELVQRCLAPAAPDRYPSAGAVAADLRRHRENRPLREVRNPWVERWQKWRRRQPSTLRFGLLVGALVLCLAVMGMMGGVFLHDRVSRADAALAVGRRQLVQQHYDDAAETLQRGLDAVQNLPVGRDLARQLAEERYRAQRGRVAQHLHDLAEQVRFRYDGTPLLPALRGSLQTACRELWDQRERLLDHRHGDLGEAAEEQIRTDLLDLALFGADLRARAAERERDPAGARREVLRLLEEAESVFGASATLARQRQACAVALGDRETAEAAARQAAQLRPRTAWEHYSLGRSLMAADDLPRAAGELAQALDQEPAGFWPRFQQGLCLYRLGRDHYRDAAEAFRVCTALAPGSAECFYNLARVEAEAGQTEAAVRDYDRALQRNPGLAEARQNRAALLQQRKHERDGS